MIILIPHIFKDAPEKQLIFSKKDIWKAFLPIKLFMLGNNVIRQLKNQSYK